MTNSPSPGAGARNPRFGQQSFGEAVELADVDNANDRNHVPNVHGAITSWPSTIDLVPPRTTSASPM